MRPRLQAPARRGGSRWPTSSGLRKLRQPHRRNPARPTAAARQLRMREAIATSMARSKREIPHYYLACAIDSDARWPGSRAQCGRAVTERLIYAVLLIEATALALREVPELNGFWIDNRAQQKAKPSTPESQFHCAAAVWSRRHCTTRTSARSMS